MLILTRSSQDVFTIGDDITITICSVDKNTGKVRIGIDAPKELAIHRHDIKDRAPKVKHAEGSPEYYREQQRRTIHLSGNVK